MDNIAAQEMMRLRGCIAWGPMREHKYKIIHRNQWCRTARFQDGSILKVYRNGTASWHHNGNSMKRKNWHHCYA